MTYQGIADAMAEQWGECEFPMQPVTDEIATGVGKARDNESV